MEELGERRWNWFTVVIVVVSLSVLVFVSISQFTMRRSLFTAIPTPTPQYPGQEDRLLATQKIQIGPFTMQAPMAYTIVSPALDLITRQSITEYKNQIPLGLGIYKNINKPENVLSVNAGIHIDQLAYKTSVSCLALSANRLSSMLAGQSASVMNTSGAAAGTAKTGQNYRVFIESTCYEIDASVVSLSDYSITGTEKLAETLIIQSSGELNQTLTTLHYNP